MKVLFLSLLFFISVNAQSGLWWWAEDTTPIDYNDNADAYFLKATDLSDSQKVNISEFCDCLDDSLNSGARNKTLKQLGFIRYWIFANGTALSARWDLTASDSISLTVAPTFTAFEGYTGNGTSQYINTNLDLSTDNESIYTLNAASFGLYYRTASTVGGWDIGVFDGTNYTMTSSYNTTQYSRVYINDNGYITIPLTHANGFKIATRLNSSTVYNYINAVGASGTAANNAIPSGDVFLFTYNNNGTPLALYQNSQISAIFFGKYFDGTEVRKITNCQERYMDGIGKGVIP